MISCLLKVIIRNKVKDKTHYSKRQAFILPVKKEKSKKKEEKKKKGLVNTVASF